MFSNGVRNQQQQQQQSPRRRESEEEEDDEEEEEEYEFKWKTPIHEWGERPIPGDVKVKGRRYMPLCSDKLLGEFVSVPGDAAQRESINEAVPELLMEFSKPRERVLVVSRKQITSYAAQLLIESYRSNVDGNCFQMLLSGSKIIGDIFCDDGVFSGSFGTNLTILDLSSTIFDDTMAQYIALLYNLQYLDLSATRITTTALRTLTRPFIVNKASFETGLPSQGLANLGYLNLSHCLGITLYERVAEMQSLSQLLLTFPSLVAFDISGIGTFPELKRIVKVTSLLGFEKAICDLRRFIQELNGWERLSQDIDLFSNAEEVEFVERVRRKPKLPKVPRHGLSAAPANFYTEPKGPKSPKKPASEVLHAKATFLDRQEQLIDELPPELKEVVLATQAFAKGRKTIIFPKVYKYGVPEEQTIRRNDLLHFLGYEIVLNTEMPPLGWRLRRFLLEANATTNSLERMLLNGLAAGRASEASRSWAILDIISGTRTAQFVRSKEDVVNELNNRKREVLQYKPPKPNVLVVPHDQHRLFKATLKRGQAAPAIVPVKKRASFEMLVDCDDDYSPPQTQHSADISPLETPSHDQGVKRKSLKDLWDEEDKKWGKVEAPKVCSRQARQLPKSTLTLKHSRKCGEMTQEEPVLVEEESDDDDYGRPEDFGYVALGDENEVGNMDEDDEDGDGEGVDHKAAGEHRNLSDVAAEAAEVADTLSPPVIKVKEEDKISEENLNIINSVLSSFTINEKAIPDWAKAIPESKWIPVVVYDTNGADPNKVESGK
ncbi:hypothetical protein HDU97_001064 [Phlyctochytrium planicorne]|nr:hypothetical protein HDU97_001064 [Phlyctochytrium planicorne]